MSGDSSKNYGGGIMIPGLTILFVGLKLGGVIGWSWWWVLSPLWIAAMIALLAIIVIAWAGSK